MKYIKIYEDVSDEPKEGDYVICNRLTITTSKDDDETLDILEKFLENNIGKVLNIIGKRNQLYVIFYKNVPKRIELYFRKIDFFKKPTYNIFMIRDEIVNFAKSKDELKLKMSTKKYNL